MQPMAVKGGAGLGTAEITKLTGTPVAKVGT